jgi:hypothetical protein
MAGPRRRFWLPSLLFCLTLLVSAALFLLVFLSPLLDNGRERPRGWARVMALFARDVVLRRTALASGLCLAVTAFVFFRPPGGGRWVGRGMPRSPKLPPPVNIAGA